MGIILNYKNHVDAKQDGLYLKKILCPYCRRTGKAPFLMIKGVYYQQLRWEQKNRKEQEK